MSVVRYTPAQGSALAKKAEDLNVSSFTALIDKTNKDGSLNLIVHMPATTGSQSAPEYVENVPSEETEKPL